MGRKDTAARARRPDSAGLPDVQQPALEARRHRRGAVGHLEFEQDAATASEKLRAAGYAQVQVFGGGLADWRAAGLPGARRR